MVMKSKFYRSLHTAGVPHPRTCYPADEALLEIARRIGFPAYVRPSQTAAFIEHFRGKGFVAHSLPELQQYLQLAQHHQVEMLVQEVIPGPTINGYEIKGYFDQHSRLLTLMAKQKLLQPSMFANSSMSISIPLAPLAEFIDVIVGYLIDLKYTGLFSAEFKRDVRDGGYKLLEVNARSVSDNYTGVRSGSNEVLLAYRDLLDESVDRQHTGYTPGITYIEEFRSLATLVQRARHGQLTMQDLRRYLGEKQLHVFAWHDFAPFRIHLRQLWNDLCRIRQGYERNESASFD
jgi:predicted ATP-grasp superfamily ATP-dependent carboligase